MTRPSCKCGHEAFVHAIVAPHGCCQCGPSCGCSAFDPAEAQPARTPITAGIFLAYTPNGPKPLPDAAERNRHALLQAAAVLLAAPASAPDKRTTQEAVFTAEALLAIIESREAVRAKEAK